MERKLSQLVERLKGAYQDRLVAVILYGSAAGGDHHPRFSDLNVLCVVKEISPRELAEAGPILRWWREHGNPAPLLLSAEEARNATDCFAIEFHDIQERRRVLYGEDVVGGIEIDECFYRAQVEHELRAKLLRLRQKAAGVLADKELLRGLLADSVSTFCVLFRHALRLAGHDLPYPGEVQPAELGHVEEDARLVARFAPRHVGASNTAHVRGNVPEHLALRGRAIRAAHLHDIARGPDVRKRGAHVIIGHHALRGLAASLQDQFLIGHHADRAPR